MMEKNQQVAINFVEKKQQHKEGTTKTWLDSLMNYVIISLKKKGRCWEKKGG